MTSFSLQDPDLFRRQAYVAGHWCDADNGATLDVNNPATGEILGTVPLMGTAETRRAIEAAKNAWGDWRRKRRKRRKIGGKVTFTGSTEVGRLLMKQSASTIKKLSLELGGNAPFIVFDDADLDAAVEGAIISKYRNAGQTCVCANRLYVQAGVYDAFAEKLVAAVKKLKVGNGFEPGVLQGPLIDQAAVEKVEEHIQDAISQGARLLLGGHRHALGQTFFEPTVLAGVTPDMKVAKEETFGPLAPLFSFDSDEQAIQMANDTEFGLASYFIVAISAAYGERPRG